MNELVSALLACTDIKIEQLVETKLHPDNEISQTEKSLPQPWHLTYTDQIAVSSHTRINCSIYYNVSNKWLHLKDAVDLHHYDFPTACWYQFLPSLFWIHHVFDCVLRIHRFGQSEEATPADGRNTSKLLPSAARDRKLSKSPDAFHRHHFQNKDRVCPHDAERYVANMRFVSFGGLIQNGPVLNQNSQALPRACARTRTSNGRCKRKLGRKMTLFWEKFAPVFSSYKTDFDEIKAVTHSFVNLMMVIFQVYSFMYSLCGIDRAIVGWAWQQQKSAVLWVPKK